MQMSGPFRWVYEIGNWLFKFMFLHLLWIVFTIVGLGVLGISPATAGIFAVMQKWITEDAAAPVLRTFFDTYKKEFISSNILGLILVALAAFLYVDFIISKQMIQSFFVHILLVILIFMYIFTLLYIFPVFVRFELKLFYYIKQSFLIALAQPLETAIMVVSVLTIYLLFSYLPLTLVFAGSTLFAYPISWIALRAFQKIKEKKTT